MDEDLVAMAVRVVSERHPRVPLRHIVSAVHHASAADAAAQGQAQPADLVSAAEDHLTAGYPGCT